MMAQPSVRALTEWGTLLGTIATIPARAIWVTVDGYLEFALDYWRDGDGTANVELAFRHQRSLDSRRGDSFPGDRGSWGVIPAEAPDCAGRSDDRIAPRVILARMRLRNLGQTAFRLDYFHGFIERAQKHRAHAHCLLEMRASDKTVGHNRQDVRNGHISRLVRSPTARSSKS